MDDISGFSGSRGSKWTIHMFILNMGNPRYNFCIQNLIKEIESENLSNLPEMVMDARVGIQTCPIGPRAGLHCTTRPSPSSGHLCETAGTRR